MEELYRWWQILLSLTLVLVITMVVYLSFPDTFNNLALTWPQGPEAETPSDPQLPIDSGLADGNGKDLTERHCLGCHSAQLIVQNRMDRQSWKRTIQWMQETQGLWDLGKDEIKVVNYLATQYAPLPSGRRRNLDIANIEWYILESPF